MTGALADTSVFIATESGRRLRQDALPDRLAVSVSTIGELRAGSASATLAFGARQRILDRRNRDGDRGSNRAQDEDYVDVPGLNVIHV